MRQLNSNPQQKFFIAIALCLSGISYALAENGLYTPEQSVRGEESYQQFCAACHGARLQGNPAAPLTGDAFRGRWEEGKHTLDDLYYIIRSLMPNNAPGSLSRAQYADIVAFHAEGQQLSGRQRGAATQSSGNEGRHFVAAPAG